MAAAQSLPAGWSSGDIGSVGAAGSSSGSGASFTVEGAGADIWGYADAFRFAYRTLAGDGTIVAQVATLDNLDNWTKGGVMMREALTPDSPHAFMLVSPGKGIAFQRRKSPGGKSYHTSGGSGKAPRFVRLTRKGDKFTGYWSADGQSWKSVGSTTIAMGKTIYVGLAVTSHVHGVPATANFDFTSVSGSTATSGGGSGSQPPGGQPATPPSSGQPSSGGSNSKTLRVLTWNTRHGGIGTDGVYDPDRLVKWIAKMDPDVASLNEVDDSRKAATIVALLAAKTGDKWSSHWDKRGNLLVTRLPLLGQSLCTVNGGAGRTATQISTMVNGRAINVWSVHFAVSGSGTRVGESKALHACQQTWSEARIAAGDFNMQAKTPEYKVMAATHDDAWVEAKALGATKNYSGNCDGCTRRSRIDYVFTSKGASFLQLKSAEIFDTRDSKGKMPSDHKPMLVTYTVR